MNMTSLTDTGSSLYIVIPAYNEEQCIPEVVREWHAVADRVGGASRLVVINDGSTDNTLGRLRALGVEYPRLDVMDKPNTGHGPSCLVGYKHAVEQSAEWVFQTDSDGQTKPEEFWAFWDARNRADFLLGCRAARGDGAGRWVISRVLRLAIMSIFGCYVRDANVPFRLMRSTKLQPYLLMIPDTFFLANALLATLLVKHKEALLWLPITFKKRQGGVPSVNYRRFFRVGCRVIGDFRSFKRGDA